MYIQSLAIAGMSQFKKILKDVLKSSDVRTGLDVLTSLRGLLN